MHEALILVVDDEEDLRRMIVRRLSKRGYVVKEAADGPTALELCRHADFDVIISDFHMPKMTGLDLFRAVKKFSPHVEFILMTAHDELSSETETLGAGACDYLQKPFDFERLNDSLQRALQLSNLRREVTLYRAVDAIFSPHDPGSLASRISRIAVDTMGADDASLMLYEDERLVLKYSSRIQVDATAPISIALGERIAGRVALQRKPILLNDMPNRERVIRDACDETPVRSAIIYPLLVRDELLGVLNISRTNENNPFNTADLERAGVLAGLVSLAIDNGRLLEQLRSQITRLEQFQSRLAQSERLAAVGFLAAGVVHEINNPVACLMGNLQYLAEELQSAKETGSSVHDELVSAAIDCCDSADRIRAIAHDMRRLARGGSASRGMVNINDAIHTAVRLTGAAVRGKAELTLDLAGDASTLGYGDQLIQVFLNLIVNAVQAITEREAQSTRKEIHIRSIQEAEKSIIEVSDTGIGVAEEHLEKIFEPLFTTKPSGTGLGLPLCRDIVEQHGGTIAVRSTPNVGTTFTVVLPRGEAYVNAATGPKSLHLLLVDDDPRVLNSLQRALSSDFDVTRASSAAEAMECSTQQRFDVVVSDVYLPDLRGERLYENLIVQQPHLVGAVVFMSGLLDSDAEDKLVRITGRPVVEKPISVAGLNEILRQIGAERVLLPA